MRDVDLTVDQPRDRNYKIRKFKDTYTQDNKQFYYEYKDLFIDMAVRNNRSELAIANRHQER